MSDQIDGTLGQTPEVARRILSALQPAFATGEAVPGLSSWVLERKLGGGGFGEVWLAKHAWNTKEKPRAVKFCTDPVAKNRLVTHEQNVVRRVMKYAGDHPNIVPLLDCNLDGDTPGSCTSSSRGAPWQASSSSGGQCYWRSDSKHWCERSALSPGRWRYVTDSIRRSFTAT